MVFTEWCGFLLKAAFHFVREMFLIDLPGQIKLGKVSAFLLDAMLFNAAILDYWQRQMHFMVEA